MNVNVPMQPMPVQYTICKSNTVAGVQDEVNRKLSKGWTLHGPTFMHGDDFVQPLVRLELRPLELPREEDNAPIVHNVPHSPLLG